MQEAMRQVFPRGEVHAKRFSSCQIEGPEEVGVLILFSQYWFWTNTIPISSILSCSNLNLIPIVHLFSSFVSPGAPQNKLIPAPILAIQGTQ